MSLYIQTTEYHARLVSLAVPVPTLYFLHVWEGHLFEVQPYLPATDMLEFFLTQWDGDSDVASFFVNLNVEILAEVEKRVLPSGDLPVGIDLCPQNFISSTGIYAGNSLNPDLVMNGTIEKQTASFKDYIRFVERHIDIDLEDIRLDHINRSK